MKQLLIFTLINLISFVTSGQIINLTIKDETVKENKVQIDSTYCNYYVLNSKDTFYFTNNSTVIQCNFTQSIDKDHNKCRFYINQEPGNGRVEIVKTDFLNKSSTTYSGTLISGFYENGTLIKKSTSGSPLITGQYVNNWKNGFWTIYYPNGQVQTIFKFIDGINDPVKTWEFDETGKLVDFTDEEDELLKLINDIKN